MKIEVKANKKVTIETIFWFKSIFISTLSVKAANIKTNIYIYKLEYMAKAYLNHYQSIQMIQQR